MLRLWLPLNGDLKNIGLDGDAVITNNGATVNTAGKIGSCYAFDGTQKITVKDPNLKTLLSNSAQSFSMSCWIYLNSDETDRVIIFGNYNANPFMNWELTAACKQRLAAGGTSNYSNKEDSTVIPKETWTHLAVTYDGSITKFYQDGIFKSQSSGANTITQAVGTDTFWLGSDARTGATMLKGRLNDFRFYDHALSAKEVEELSMGLVLHYKLDKSAGMTDLATLNASYTIYNNHNNTNMPSTLVDSGTTYRGSKVFRETCTPTDNSLNSIKTSLHSHGVYNWRRTFTANTKYVFWIYYKPISHNDTICGGTASNIGGWTEIPPVAVGDGWYRVGQYRNGTVTDDKTDNIFVSFKVPSATTGTPIIIDWASPHLLEGTSEIPNEDYFDNIIYDCSGYENNGIGNKIKVESNTSRYTLSSLFNGIDSYIKCNTNNWMVNPMTELTINVWIKDSTWPANGGRILSCTESGGWNLEGGNSGYWRFPIHVYTAADLSTTAYKYDSKEIQISALSTTDWNMITLVYRANQGTKTYINGQLHHTYNNVSYGIHYNRNARLFLGCEANTASPGGQYYNGYESDFRIYATALTDEQILELYNTSGTIDKSGNLYAREVIE